MTDSIEMCYSLLPKVSRSFALSISKLKEPLRKEVCVTYLICRILDTIEDSPTLFQKQKEEFIFSFLEILEERKLKKEFFENLYDSLNEDPIKEEKELIKHGIDVYNTYNSVREESKKAILPWVIEMGKGMVLFLKEMETKENIRFLKTMKELDNYCYYIAGTVGFMLTNLFNLNSPHIDDKLYEYLLSRANDFGLSLQKVNILKDIRDDVKRGWCFVPVSLLESNEMRISDLMNEENGEKLFNSLIEFFLSLKNNFIKAFEYVFNFPENEKEIRLFLLSSLFFASETVKLMFKKKKELLSKKKIKISRSNVMDVLLFIEKNYNDNKRLASFWEASNKKFFKEIIL